MKKRKGFSYEKSQRITERAFAVSDWFKVRGAAPGAWMDLFSEIIISDEPLTAKEIARAKALAEAKAAKAAKGTT